MMEDDVRVEDDDDDDDAEQMIINISTWILYKSV